MNISVDDILFSLDLTTNDAVISTKGALMHHICLQSSKRLQHADLSSELTQGFPLFTFHKKVTEHDEKKCIISFVMCILEYLLFFAIK